MSIILTGGPESFINGSAHQLFVDHRLHLVVLTCLWFHVNLVRELTVFSDISLRPKVSALSLEQRRMEDCSLVNTSQVSEGRADRCSH